jgi:hypothetical protein
MKPLTLSIRLERRARTAGVLALARLVESDRTAQEAELDALAELNEWGLVSALTLKLLARLDQTTLDSSQLEFLGYLLPT